MFGHDSNAGGVTMQYPRFPSTPVTGDPGNPDLVYPYDLWPSAHNEMAYPTHRRSTTRTLGGLGGQDGGLGAFNAEETTEYAGLEYARRQARLEEDASNQNYPSELESLSHMDDTSGNGIFDAYNSYPNINEDAGVFADQASMPGYLMREKFFDGKGEVIDVNTGRPSVFIPGTSFMIDRRLPGTLDAERLYIPGWPGTEHARTVPQLSTVVPDGPSWAVRGLSDAAAPPEEKKTAGRAEMFVMAGVAGLALGLVLGLTRKKKP